MNVFEFHEIFGKFFLHEAKDHTKGYDCHPGNRDQCSVKGFTFDDIHFYSVLAP